MDQKKKIVFIWNYLNWGGAQIYFLAIIKAARPEWDVLVILPRESSKVMIGFLEELNITYELSDHPIDLSPASGPVNKIQRQIKRIISEFAMLRRIVRSDKKKTIFHIEIAPWQSWIFLTAVNLVNAKTVVTMHNIMPFVSTLRQLIWKIRMQVISHLKGFRIIASNNDTKERLAPFVTKTFWQKIVVAPTAVDPMAIDLIYNSLIERDVIRKNYDIDPDDFTVLAVGQFVDRKGRWVFMDAAKKLKTENTDIQFMWLTPVMPSASDLEKIEEYDLNNSFKLILSENVGSERADVLNFFRIADVFALPSFIEGLPIALLEAMSLGIPSISTNVFAIPEAVKNNKTGLLIEAGDADGLAGSILKFKNDMQLRLSIAENGRKYVLENFNEQDSAEKVISVYKELLLETK